MHHHQTDLRDISAWIADLREAQINEDELAASDALDKLEAWIADATTNTPPGNKEPDPSH